MTGDHEMTTSHERKEFAQCADTGFESQEGTGYYYLHEHNNYLYMYDVSYIIIIAILERNDGRNKMTSVPSAYFTVATMTANVPFLHYRLLEANYDGLEHTLIDHDVTVRIPKGAVPMGKKISLEIAVTMYGPFYHSGDAQPISPIIWLCLLDEDITLTKPFEVVIPHFLTKLTREKVLLHEIGFAKAHHENYSLNDDMHYHFLPCEENFLHASNKSRGYGILQTTHCCFYCIKSKKSPALASDASYCLVQYVSHSLGFQKTEIHFVAIYLLPTCMKVY